LPTGKKTKEEKTQKKLLKILLSTQITANFVSFQNCLFPRFFVIYLTLGKTENSKNVNFC